MVLLFSGFSLVCRKVQSALNEWIYYRSILTSEGSKVGRVHVDKENRRPEPGSLVAIADDVLPFHYLVFSPDKTNQKAR